MTERHIGINEAFGYWQATKDRPTWDEERSRAETLLWDAALTCVHFCINRMGISPAAHYNDDIIAAGIEGFYKGIQTHNSDKGAPVTWVTVKTRFAIIDYFREQDVYTRSDRKRLNRTTEGNGNGDVPLVSVVSLDEAVDHRDGNKPVPLAEIIPDEAAEAALEAVENLDLQRKREAFVAAYMADQPERLQQLILLTSQGLSQKEIAGKLRISESSVSQLKRKIIRGCAQAARKLNIGYR